jgi:hypothetical protein
VAVIDVDTVATLSDTAAAMIALRMIPAFMICSLELLV